MTFKIKIIYAAAFIARISGNVGHVMAGERTMKQRLWRKRAVRFVSSSQRQSYDRTTRNLSIANRLRSASCNSPSGRNNCSPMTSVTHVKVVSYDRLTSFKVIGIGNNRKSICDFLLVFHCSYMHIYRFHENLLVENLFFFAIFIQPSLVWNYRKS